MAEDKTTTTPEETKDEAKPAEAEAPKKAPKRKKAKRSVPHGQMHVLATFNNTIVTFSDTKGNVLAYSSAGACGFRGSKKGTAYAAQVAAERAATAAKQQYGLSKADVFIKGIGLGRDATVRTLSGLDIQVESINDVTGVPHGGVRPRKARRV
jgi:small subunit ribosomal protein S11